MAVEKGLYKIIAGDSRGNVSYCIYEVTRESQHPDECITERNYNPEMPLRPRSLIIQERRLQLIDTVKKRTNAMINTCSKILNITPDVRFKL